MDTERICPSCQKPLAPDVPLGLCPECLIKSGFPTGVESADAKRPPFIPPTVEELTKLFPQLEILELIGKGGMGAVYKARQPKLNRFVALKILPHSIGNDPAFAERFAREAQALAQLNHPGIVILYEFGQAGGLHFFMMEYVDGVNLRQLLINGRIAPREALAIVPQICDALQFAHDQGIVHRDIKPENILLDRRGHVKIADFGLAKIIGGENEPASGSRPVGSPLLTETGKIIGTPQYMSPEQIAHPAEVDHRADIYALGVVFYQMLTGELPGKRIEPPSKKVHIDVRLDEVVLRALEKNPELRYQQANTLKTHVETIAGTPRDKLSLAPERNAPLAYVALFFAGLSGILGTLAFCLFPNPPTILVWSILAAASLGIILGIPSHRNRLGKSAIGAGSIDIAIWLIVLIVWNAYQGTPFYIGQTSFPKGDSIEITSVRRTKEQMVVKGHYNLVSTDRAQLALYITSSSNRFGLTDPKQWIQISKGSGDFKLIHPHLVPGLPHVTMYTMDAVGKPFAGVYFGSKDEAREESKLDLGYYQSSNGAAAAAPPPPPDISSQTSPFRDTAKYLSPFATVHFDTNDINKVVVAYNGSEYELAAIDDLPVADILGFCRRQYGQPPFGEGWAQKRFAEDLVVVLSDMKHPVSSDNTVSLTLVDPQTGQQKIIAHARMTRENRAAIFQDRTLDNSKLLQSLPQN